MANVFGSIPVPRKGRTNFDLSHSLAGTFSLSDLQPVLFLDALPGSSYRINVFNLTKLETLIAPAMQQVNASLLTFKVPKRLCFNRFKDWYSGGSDGMTDAEKPHFNLFEIIDEIENITEDWSLSDKKDLVRDIFGPGSLWNYLGLPCPLEFDSSTGVWDVPSFLSVESFYSSNPQAYEQDGFIDAMPFIAYWLLHDEYFMDQTLNKRMFVNEHNLEIGTIKFDWSNGNERISFDAEGNTIADGGRFGTDIFLVLNQLFKRAWRKDYFTSALPTPQRGPEVSFDVFNGKELPITGKTTLNVENEGPIGASYEVVSGEDYNNKLSAIGDGPALEVSTPGLNVDLSGLSPITITAFRNLFKLQAFLEKNNVAGGRFIETILAHWGERVPDFTVQRPVHVRSTSIPVQVSEITAMANSEGLNPQLGDQAGRAKGMGNLGKISVYTQEPCFIFSLYCVTVPPSYANQGIPRIFQHITRFDEPWTDFQHIGEQAIKNRELYFDWTSKGTAYNNQDFGYQQRFSEYKYLPDRIVGDFQTNLSFWTMARMFNELPYLNEDFVTHNPDARIFAVKAKRPVTASFYFDIKCKLKLSRYSTPKLT